jgi:hypothetical protein
MNIEDNIEDKSVEKYASTLERVAELKRSDDGKYKVIGIDKFDGEDWVQGEYSSAEEAMGVARKLTKKAMGSASDSSIATVYYAYNPKGGYLGGDTWHNE